MQTEQPQREPVEVKDILYPARELLREERERERQRKWEEEEQARVNQQLERLRSLSALQAPTIPLPKPDSYSSQSNLQFPQAPLPAPPNGATSSFANLPRPSGALPVPPSQANISSHQTDPNLQFAQLNQNQPGGFQNSPGAHGQYPPGSNPQFSHLQPGTGLSSSHIDPNLQHPQFAHLQSGAQNAHGIPGAADFQAAQRARTETAPAAFSGPPAYQPGFAPPQEDDLSARMRRLSMVGPSGGSTSIQNQTIFDQGPGGQHPGSQQQGFNPAGSFQGAPGGYGQGGIPSQYSSGYGQVPPQFQAQPQMAQQYPPGQFRTTITQEEYYRQLAGMPPPSYSSAQNLGDQYAVPGWVNFGPPPTQPDMQLAVIPPQQSQQQHHVEEDDSDDDVNPFENSLNDEESWRIALGKDDPDRHLNRDDLIHHTQRTTYRKSKVKRNAAKVLIPIAACGTGVVAGAVGGAVIGAAAGGVGAPVGAVIGAVVGGTVGTSMGVAATAGMKSKSVVPYSQTTTESITYSGNSRCGTCQLPFSSLSGNPFRCPGCNFTFCSKCGVYRNDRRYCEDCGRNLLPARSQAPRIQYY